jgi:hypothetical protein
MLPGAGAAGAGFDETKPPAPLPDRPHNPEEVAMRVVFVERDNAPERLVCEAEIVFEADAGPLAGMKLVGFSLWRSPEGEVYVTFPSRAFGSGSERRFFDFLRSVEGTAADAKRVKGWILDEFHLTRRTPDGGLAEAGVRGISKASSKAVQEGLSESA